MNYPQSLAYLDSFYDLEKSMMLPASHRWKLERMRRLLALFGHPEKSFKSVVIVGTKGKGSTGFFLQSILNEAGIPAGFYSSPHLETPRERIRINGKMISKTLWARILTRISMSFPRSFGGNLKVLDPRQKHAGMTESLSNILDSVTYFEIMTLMAALAFQERGMRAGVFEAGMGGRLDAVNALGAKIVVVTPIGLDHQEFLGNTLTAIAREKAAVIHAGAEGVVAPQRPAVERVIHARAKQMHARLWPVMRKVRLGVGLLGDHQKWNAAAAVKTAFLLGGSGKSIPARALQKGLAARDWPGRFEMIPGRPRIILDGAHNPVAIDALVKTWQGLPLPVSLQKKQVLIFGATRDKNSLRMLQKLARLFSRVILTPLPVSRGKTTAALLAEACRYFPVQIPAADINEALSIGRRLAGRQGQILITGSFYLAGEARKLLKKRKPGIAPASDRHFLL